ncbi:hypothetical protein B7P43_G02600, partial [Cryptotermes secundus]
VPRTLTDVNKMVRMQASRLLQQFEDEGNSFLKSIVTTDETWVHYFIPESQQSSREWWHTSSPKPKRARRSRSAGKVMATFFWDWQGVIHVDFLTDARTVNAAYYSDLLATDVKEKIRSKRKTGGKRVAFLQDNARPYTAKTTLETLRKLKWKLLTHPPYSPDLAPSDFYLSSLARKSGSWVRIPHKAWMFGVCVCVYAFILCLCCIVFRFKELYRL